MDKIDIGKRIKAEREKRKWTQEYLATLLNIKVGTLSGYERNYRQPDIQMLNKLAKAFNVSTDYLLGREEQSSSKDLVPPDAIPVGELVRIPVYGEIRAGEPAFVRDEIIDWKYLPAWQVKGGNYFYLRVKGDSMEEARILDGDYVLVRCQPTLEDGDIGVVSIIGESANEYGSEATIKKFYRKGNMVVLQPANSKYNPIIVPAKDVHIIGEVVRVEFYTNGNHL